MMPWLLLFYAALLTSYFTSAWGYSATGDRWSIRQQDDHVCKADTRHFSGRVKVTETKNLFFWFFESRQDAENRPVVIWLSGGPSASSMFGLFGEIGPCLLNNKSTETYKNDYSWANYANMLFIDQPAGVGLSTINDTSKYPHNLSESSADFSTLLHIFFKEIFPQYSKNELYIAGESFAGRYIPKFAFDIAQKQKQSKKDALVHGVNGIILVDALIDAAAMYMGHYEMFCSDKATILHFNQSTCQAIAGATMKCQSRITACEQLYNANVCQAAENYCETSIGQFFQEEVDLQRRSPYDLRDGCKDPPLCNTGGHVNTSKYLNNPAIQGLLGFEPPITYTSINFALNSQWGRDPEIHLPTTRELSYLLDSTSTDILVLNGNHDVTINTPGVIRQYDNLRWFSQAQYQLQKLHDWYWMDEHGKKQKGGETKGVPRLQVATVDNAGHTVPVDQRMAVTEVVGRWLATRGKTFF